MRINEVCPHCKAQTATFWVRRNATLALYKCLRDKCGQCHERPHPKAMRPTLVQDTIREAA